MDAARKAKNPKTWKEVAFAALNKGELKFAHTAALSLIVHPDHLDSLIERYEQLGLFSQLIELLVRSAGLPGCMDESGRRGKKEGGRANEASV